jgi:threonine/homoserine/homoserine lactone efflux protein
MLTLFIAAFVLGLVFNATPGPVFAETVRQGVRGDFRLAVFAQIGSLVGDARWARLTYRACAIAFLTLTLSMLRELWVAHQRSPAGREPRPNIGEPRAHGRV